MSTATAKPEPAPAAKGKKKKLIVIVAAAVLLLVLGGGTAAVLLLQKKNADAELAEDGDDQGPGSGTASDRPRPLPSTPPTFVPLENFTVNLADRDADRFAQVGVTLEIRDPKVADQIRAYMPAIRNRILMAIADRTASELVTREGKQDLAEKIRSETARVLGYAPPKPAAKPASPGAGTAGAAGAPSKAKPRGDEPPQPIEAVHFSSFIVQ